MPPIIPQPKSLFDGKCCACCKMWRLLTDYSPREGGRLKSDCKPCRQIKGQEYKKRNADKVNVTNAAYREANKDNLRLRSKEWREAHPEQDYRIHRKWKQANPAACRASDHRRYYANLDYYRVLNNIRTHARRVIIRTERGNYTPAEWQAIKERQGFRCLMCGKQEPEIKLTVDHVIPIIKGGLNTADNLAGLCKPCNSKKGTKTLDLRPK